MNSETLRNFATCMYTWLNQVLEIQSNLPNTDTEGTEQRVRIREVSVL